MYVVPREPEYAGQARPGQVRGQDAGIAGCANFASDGELGSFQVGLAPSRPWLL